MQNQSEDALVEFAVERRPRLFGLVPVLMLLLCAGHLVQFAGWVKDVMLQRRVPEVIGIYLFSLLTFYPFIGVYGYLRRMRYGWVVLAHYSLSCSTIFFVVSVSRITRFDPSDSYIRLGVVALAMLANLICVVVLFHRTYLSFFYLTRDNIFYVVILTIVFPILNGIIFSFF